MGVIRRAKYTANPAPDAWLDKLAAGTPAHVVINGMGEETDLTPQEVADYIKGGFTGGGGVWVDYCGYPFWYYYDRVQDKEFTLAQYGWGGPKLSIFPNGFTDELFDGNSADFGNTADILNPATFGDGVEPDFYAPSWFEYRRALHLAGVTPGKLSAADRLIINYDAPYAADTFSCFAIRVSRLVGSARGYYFYASWDGSRGVDPDVYLAFINKVLKYDQADPTGPGSGLPVPPGGIIPDIKSGMLTILIGGAAVGLLAASAWKKARG